MYYNMTSFTEENIQNKTISDIVKLLNHYKNKCDEIANTEENTSKKKENSALNKLWQVLKESKNHNTEQTAEDVIEYKNSSNLTIMNSIRLKESYNETETQCYAMNYTFYPNMSNEIPRSALSDILIGFKLGKNERICADLKLSIGKDKYCCNLHLEPGKFVPALESRSIIPLCVLNFHIVSLKVPRIVELVLVYASLGSDVNYDLYGTSCTLKDKWIYNKNKKKYFILSKVRLQLNQMTFH